MKCKQIKGLQFSFLVFGWLLKKPFDISYLYIWISEHMKEKQMLTRLLRTESRISLDKDDAQVSNYGLLQIRVWTLQDL